MTVTKILVTLLLLLVVCLLFQPVLYLPPEGPLRSGRPSTPRQPVPRAGNWTL
jgi:hypothetical protein